MFTPLVSNHSIRSYRAQKRALSGGKKFCLVAPAVVASSSLAMISCSEKAAPPPPSIFADVKPVGDGLSVIGLALIAAAVVLVLGKLLR